MSEDTYDKLLKIKNLYTAYQIGLITFDEYFNRCIGVENE